MIAMHSDKIYMPPSFSLWSINGRVTDIVFEDRCRPWSKPAMFAEHRVKYQFNIV
jgi:hypothetical protein